jgi:sugar diacid utilization regulator
MTSPIAVAKAAATDAQTFAPREGRELRASGRERRLAEAERAARRQARLTGAALDGAEIDDIVALLGEVLARPVALLTPALQVRTWAPLPVMRPAQPPSLPRIALAAPAVRDALGELGRGRPSTVLAPHRPSGLTRRHLVAVLRSADDVLGFLDVVEIGRPLDRVETVVAEHAAALLSLQIRAEAQQIRAAAQALDDVLSDLLRGSRSPEDLRRIARHVGLDLQRPHLIVRLPVAPERSAAACLDDVVEAVTPVLDGPPSAIAGPDAVLLLVALPAEAGPPVLRRLHRGLREVLDAVAAHTGVPRAIVSAVCHDVADFPAAHDETGEIAEIVTALGETADVVPVTEFSTLRLVVNGDRADVAVRFARRCLGPLRRCDDVTGGDLVQTLRSYLECGAQVRATARALGVHENTVRYRLGRIEHITGLDTRRFDALLTAQLAFQVENLARGSG